MSAVPAPSWKCARFRQRLARSALESPPRLGKIIGSPSCVQRRHIRRGSQMSTRRKLLRAMDRSTCVWSMLRWQRSPSALNIRVRENRSNLRFSCFPGLRCRFAYGRTRRTRRCEARMRHCLGPPPQVLLPSTLSTRRKLLRAMDRSTCVSIRFGLRLGADRLFMRARPQSVPQCWWWTPSVSAPRPSMKETVSCACRIRFGWWCRCTQFSDWEP